MYLELTLSRWQKTPLDVCTSKSEIKLGADEGTAGLRHQGFTFDNATGTLRPAGTIIMDTRHNETCTIMYSYGHYL